MKTALEHLPKLKRDELATIKELILNNGKSLSIEMIILFGSYARGDWIHDRHLKDDRLNEYISDYDILCVTKSKKAEKNFMRWGAIDDIISRQNYSTDPTIIAHDIKYLNRQIEDHNSFFCDILKDGIMLYDSGNYQLAEPGTLPAKRVKEKAIIALKEWSESANHFYDNFRFNFEKERYKIAAFELHQSTERLYHCFIDVYTGYSPKLHDIEKLDKRAIQIKAEMYNGFPKESKEDRRLFDLLKRAYVGARYKNSYFATKEELKVLGQKVEKFRDLVLKLCKEYIDSLTISNSI